MPVVRLLSNGDTNDELMRKLINKIKDLGKMLGYKNPDMIWVETSPSLSQNDVAFVMVYATKKDRRKKKFQGFCKKIAYEVWNHTANKSIEVASTAIKSMAWKPAVARRKK